MFRFFLSVRQVLLPGLSASPNYKPTFPSQGETNGDVTSWFQTGS